jgi:hypothetical protein
MLPVAVIVAAFFNALFLMLTVRVLCGRLVGLGDEERPEAAEAAGRQADAQQQPRLQRVTPAIVVHPGLEVRPATQFLLFMPRRSFKCSLRVRITTEMLCMHIAYIMI